MDWNKKRETREKVFECEGKSLRAYTLEMRNGEDIVNSRVVCKENNPWDLGACRGLWQGKSGKVTAGFLPEWFWSIQIAKRLSSKEQRCVQLLDGELHDGRDHAVLHTTGSPVPRAVPETLTQLEADKCVLAKLMTTYLDSYTVKSRTLETILTLCWTILWF